jgi:G3E family GTPase
MLEPVKTQSHQLPILIVTGFLGAGKTSFISKLLTLKFMANSAVILNEYGEIGLDHILVDSVNDQIIDLPNGCLCCSSSSALSEKLMALSVDNRDGRINIDRIIIETSGITDTTNLIQFLWNNTQIRESFQLSNVLTIISALGWKDSQIDFQEAESQLSISDVVIIAKTDLLPKTTKEVELAHLLTEVEMINPGSRKYITPLSPMQFRDILEHDSRCVIPPAVKSSLTHNTSIYKTCTLSTIQPLSFQVISLFLNIVITRHADKLLRIKGLVLTNEDPSRPLIIQVVKSTITPFSWLDNWPDLPGTKIVLIHTYLDNSLFIDLFNSVTDNPAIDQPDNLALSNNPLTITGLGKFKSE